MPVSDLPKNPRVKLERLRNLRDQLRALKELSDAKIAAAEQRAESAANSIAEYEAEPVLARDGKDELLRAKADKIAAQRAKYDEAKQAAAAERDASRELRADFEAAQRTCQRLEEFDARFVVPDGDPRRMVRAKILIGSLVNGGKSYGPGSIVEISEPEAKSLQRKGFVTIC